MPRASRNSQAAMASAVVPDESLRTFYTYNPNVSTSSSSDALSTHTNNDDPMWTRRTGGGSSATTGMTTRRVSGRGSTSNMTDVSVSSASLNSPMQSSHAASEASSYATRGVPGVIDELDERNAEQNRDHEDDHDSDESEGIVVVARSSTLNANRRRRVPRGSDEGTPERDNRMADGSELNHNQNDTSEGISTSHFSSRLLDESEDDDLTNGTNGGGGYNSHLNGDNDSLADALPEEVEARAREVIGWETVGQDTELYVVDLERWKNINDKYSTPGTAEYQSVKAIQAELLTAVQELETTEWMFPEPLPFTTYLPEPSSTIGQKVQTTLPFHNDDVYGNNLAAGGGIGGGGNSRSWCDLAFNPLSTFTPLAPIGQATYPDTYRVQRALGASTTSLPPKSSNSQNAPFHLNNINNNTDRSIRQDNHSNSSEVIRKVGYHGNAISKRKPDFTWLESEAKEILLQDKEIKSFNAKSKFPWATALLSNSTSRNGFENQRDDKNMDSVDYGNPSMIRGNSMSLTKEVGIIRLQ